MKRTSACGAWVLASVTRTLAPRSAATGCNEAQLGSAAHEAGENAHSAMVQETMTSFTKCETWSSMAPHSYVLLFLSATLVLLRREMFVCAPVASQRPLVLGGRSASTRARLFHRNDAPPFLAVAVGDRYLGLVGSGRRSSHGDLYFSGPGIELRLRACRKVAEAGMRRRFLRENTSIR